VGAPLVGVAVIRKQRSEDVFSMVAALIAIAVVSVAALTYVGAVDPDPSRAASIRTGPWR